MGCPVRERDQQSQSVYNKDAEMEWDITRNLDRNWWWRKFVGNETKKLAEEISQRVDKPKLLKRWNGIFEMLGNIGEN